MAESILFFTVPREELCSIRPYVETAWRSPGYPGEPWREHAVRLKRNSFKTLGGICESSGFNDVLLQILQSMRTIETLKMLQKGHNDRSPIFYYEYMLKTIFLILM